MTTATNDVWSDLEKCTTCAAPSGQPCRSLKNGQPVGRPHKGRKHLHTVDTSAHLLNVEREKIVTMWTWFSWCSCGKFRSDNYGDSATARRAHERHVRSLTT